MFTFSTAIRKITPETRCLLLTHLKELQVSHSVIARTLGISDSTLIKWERGMTTYCTINHGTILKDFLNGKLDRQIQENRFIFAGEKFNKHATFIADTSRHFKISLSLKKGNQYLTEFSRVIQNTTRQLIAELLPLPNSFSVIHALLKCVHKSEKYTILDSH